MKKKKLTISKLKIYEKEKQNFKIERSRILSAPNGFETNFFQIWKTFIAVIELSGGRADAARNTQTRLRKMAAISNVHYISIEPRGLPPNFLLDFPRNAIVPSLPNRFFSPLKTHCRSGLM